MTPNSDPDSVPAALVRPEDLMEELGIKKDAYYADLKYLNIQPIKDSEGKVWLTFEDAERIRHLRSHVEQKGKRNGFEENSIVKADDNNLANSPNSIHVESREAIETTSFDRVLNNAYDLKARELAASDLAVRAIADRITEDDLPQHLKETLEAVRESVAPKWTPDSLADQILAYHRHKQGGK
jgi:hypothetical protein